MAPPAHAGAWIAADKTQFIATEVLGERADGAFSETQIFLERPLNAGFSVVLRPWFEAAETDGDVAYRNETTAALKAVVHRGERHVAALQAGALWRSLPDPACGESGYELRALVGRSSEAGGVFANVETALQTLGSCQHTKLDFSLGFRPRERWLGLVETFIHEEDGAAGEMKAQFSLVRFLQNGTGIQFGVRVGLDDDEAEPALVVALWREDRGDD